VGMLLATIFVVMATLAGAIGSTAVASAMVMLVFALAATVGLRMALVAPVLACELERNPVSAMRRSWQLTQGSALRLASFLLLALMLFMLIYGLIMLFIGVVLSLTTSGDVQRLAAAIVSSTMTAAAMVYAGAILAAVHRQLAGPPASEMTSTFD
jgi:membrane-anchored glycerophosphoryl diester phosphodiesterase (GDPDase)